MLTSRRLQCSVKVGCATHKTPRKKTPIQFPPYFGNVSETRQRNAFPGMLTAVGCKREPDSERGFAEKRYRWSGSGGWSEDKQHTQRSHVISALGNVVGWCGMDGQASSSSFGFWPPAATCMCVCVWVWGVCMCWWHDSDCLVLVSSSRLQFATLQSTGARWLVNGVWISLKANRRRSFGAQEAEEEEEEEEEEQEKERKKGGHWHEILYIMVCINVLKC